MNVLQDTKFWWYKILAIVLKVQIWQIIYWQTLVTYWMHSLYFINILLRIECFGELKTIRQTRQNFFPPYILYHTISYCVLYCRLWGCFMGSKKIHLIYLIFSVN